MKNLLPTKNVSLFPFKLFAISLKNYVQIEWVQENEYDRVFVLERERAREVKGA